MCLLIYLTCICVWADFVASIYNIIMHNNASAVLCIINGKWFNNNIPVYYDLS